MPQCTFNYFKLTVMMSQKSIAKVNQKDAYSQGVVAAFGIALCFLPSFGNGSLHANGFSRSIRHVTSRQVAQNRTPIVGTISYMENRRSCIGAGRKTFIFSSVSKHWRRRSLSGITLNKIMISINSEIGRVLGYTHLEQLLLNSSLLQNICSSSRFFPPKY